MPRQSLGHDAETETPSGHRVGLREAVHDHGALGHTGQRRDRRALAVVHHAGVDLVRDDREVVPLRELGDGRERRGRDHAAGGIVRRVEQQDARTRRDARLERGEIHVEALRGQQRHGHDARPEELGDGIVVGERGARDEHLVAGFEQRDHGEEQDRLGAGRDDDVRRLARDPATLAPLRGDGATELGQPRGRTVVRVAGLERLGGGATDE